MACENLLAIVLGCVFGTLVFCLVIAAIVGVILWKRFQTSNEKLNRAHYRKRDSDNNDIEGAGVDNSGYSADHQEVNFSSETNKSNGLVSQWNHKPSLTSQREDNPEDEIEVKLKNKNKNEGLGFEFRGNQKDGMVITNVNENTTPVLKGCIGYKVMSMTVSFAHIQYEDALTLLTYASAYPITLRLDPGNHSKPHPDESTSEAGHSSRDSSSSESEQEEGTADNENEAEGEQLQEDESKTGSDVDAEDDDTKRRAPEYLPVSIKTLVESKKSGREAVTAIETHSSNGKSETGVTPSGDKQLVLSPGAQSALDMLLSTDEEDN